MNTQLLEIDGLRTYFFTADSVVKAVDGVDLTISRGETLGLLGESGCGKTQTALSIIRLIPSPGKIIAGKVLFEGQDLLRKGDDQLREIRGNRIAMIFQDPMTSLNPVYTVGEQIAEVFCAHRRIFGAEAWTKAVKEMELVGIAEARLRSSDYPHQFSGGMRQRIMIAMALACRPSLLIADEPTTALDVTAQAQILELMKKLRKEVNTSIMLITHDVGVITELCDRVAVMYAGKVVESSDVRTILKEPLHPYTQGLLQSLPRERKTKARLIPIPGQVPSMINLPKGCRFRSRCSKSIPECEVEPNLVEVKPGHMVRCLLFTEGGS